MTPWLFLHEGNCPPALTMETDLELFEAVRAGAIKGSLRVYNWTEPAVTTGFHQKSFTFHDRDLVLPVLHRPTGGGAVLHGNDITFSICTPLGAAFPPGIPECSGYISRIFASALGLCGVEAGMKGGRHLSSPVCFARPSPAELLTDGRKILGLALARKGGFILAQGVIPLRVDRGLAERVFGDHDMPECRGILEMYPDFSPALFLVRLRECLASHAGVLLQESRQGDHEYHGTDQCEIEPG